MSEVSAHLSEPGGSRRLGKVASGRRGRRQGVEIKPGSVKQARSEAGLSLGQVAREDISRTAIYFVETGKAKPSIETLTLIAERTGKPIEYFLAEPADMRTVPPMGVAEVERLLATGDPAGAVVAGEAALSRRLDPEHAARARFLLAMACLRTGQAVRGRREVSLARAHYEQTGDTLMIAECLGTEASAAYLIQDPGALALAEAGLATVRSINPVPAATEARLLSIVGAVHTVNHDWAKAIEFYEQAVEVGSVVQDLRSLSYMYGNLSLAYQETGRLGEASRYAHRAMAIYETLNDRLSLAGAENDLALLVYKQGNMTDALRHAHRALSMWEDTGIEARKAHVLMTLAELELARSELEAAADYGARALELASRIGERANVGEAHAWLGRIAEAAGDTEEADARFASAIEELRALGPGERLSRIHALYAEILEGRGDLGRANAHLKQALKSTRPVEARETRAVSA
jgi:tetratricopeptide (TPR) repeat protein/DNA-binding XRE family transcriptional regulator